MVSHAERARFLNELVNAVKTAKPADPAGYLQKLISSQGYSKSSVDDYVKTVIVKLEYEKRSKQ